MREWFESHGIRINAPPLFRYNLDFPHLSITKVGQDTMNLDNRRKWINPKTSLGRNVAHYEAHILHTSEDGLIITPSYMDGHLSYTMYGVSSWIGI